jgi:hypothetical protein
MPSGEKPPQQATGDSGVYELAYNEGMRQLEHQERSLDELRTRTATLLAASALTTSFLGAAALPHGPVWTVPVLIALTAFLIGIVTCVAVLWPRGHWEFVNAPERVIGDYAEGEPPATLPETHRDLALHAGTHATRNARRLGLRYIGFDIAAIALLVQVIAWLVALLGGSST